MAAYARARRRIPRRDPREGLGLPGGDRAGGGRGGGQGPAGAAWSSELPGRHPPLLGLARSASPARERARGRRRAGRHRRGAHPPGAAGRRPLGRDGRRGRAGSAAPSWARAGSPAPTPGRPARRSRGCRSSARCRRSRVAIEIPYEKVGGAVKRLLRPPEIELETEEYGAAARLVLAVHEERLETLREALAELGVAAESCLSEK